ncbi:CASP-like protein 2B1 [Amaranthus tricolor]|uniref:CASP-like protein 2B1 n=1 Tax=Amaranthus tricolor TaxID=29722 RepID=UPI0025861337|nr:CASP-like protein 2B1 [Amaranthus tricolor]
MSFGTSPGNVAVHHGNCTAKVIEKRVKIAELVLRVLIFGLSVLAASLIGFDSEVKVIFSITKKAKFTDMKALVFLVIANGIAAAYSLVQAVRCVVEMIRGSVLFSKPLAWAIFSGDQVMAYLTLAAVAAAMQSSVIGKFGQTELKWMKTCGFYEKFCNQIAKGIASSVAVSLCTVLLSCISAYSLFRLYGGNKRKMNLSW